jgi:hypothetical protein
VDSIFKTLSRVEYSPVSVRLRIIHHNIYVGLTNTSNPPPPSPPVPRLPVRARPKLTPLLQGEDHIPPLPAYTRLPARARALLLAIAAAPVK